MSQANSAEFDKEGNEQVIYLMKEWYDERTGITHIRDEESEMGGTLRLGSYPCVLKEDTFAAKAYGCTNIAERHRHRFEFNPQFREKLTKDGLIISGTSPDDSLVEIVEIADHPWFLGCQFHPEFKSRPMTPHPLFREFIKAGLIFADSRKVEDRKQHPEERG